MMTDPVQSAWVHACRGKHDDPEIQHPLKSQQYPPRISADFLAMTCFRETAFHGSDSQNYMQNLGRLANALLQARAEIIGGRTYPGVQHNLLCALADMDISALSAEQYAYLQLWQKAHPEPMHKIGFISHAIDEDLVDALLLCLNDEERFLQYLEQLPTSNIKSETEPSLQDDAEQDTQQAAAMLEEDSSEVETLLQSPDEDQPGTLLPDIDLRKWDGYKIFDKSHDQVIPASQMAGKHSYADLRNRLLQDIPDYELLSRRLVNRLRRVLLALQRRSWLYDREEGWLNPARLASWVAAPSSVHPFRQETDNPFPETAMTLLLDCSGSMRGQPILMAAACIDVLTQALEQCGIAVEVLGYTTGDWDDGFVASAWDKAGRPQQPGRLNSLQHVVFKEFFQPWRRARQSLGVVLHDEWMRENIDGEALWWAHQRLAKRFETRKLLLAISDGLPRDAMTDETNGKTYLVSHLRQVIDEIEQGHDIELSAIGVGHTVERFYPQSVSISQMSGLAKVLTGKLTEIFSTDAEKRRSLLQLY